MLSSALSFILREDIMNRITVASIGAIVVGGLSYAAFADKPENALVPHRGVRVYLYRQTNVRVTGKG